MFTKKITLGVTGLSKAGKTVFISALTQALLTSSAWTSRRGQGPLAHFEPFERGIFHSAKILDEVHSDLPHFPFRKIRDCLTSKNKSWPEATVGISRLVVEMDFRVQKWYGKRLDSVQLELIDYPGEWLADLPMLKQSYADWSDQMLEIAFREKRKEWSHDYFERLTQITKETESQTDHEEIIGQLTDLWEKYLQLAAEHGFSLNQPGRVLRPGEMLHSPVLRLVPLPNNLRDSPLGKKLKKRFKDYQKKVIRPFYTHYFSKMDRQIVLVDVLRTLEFGENIFNEMMETMSQTLHSFDYSKGGLLSWLVGARTTHVLFAATKADHVIRSDRVNLEKTLRKMISLVDDQNLLRGSVLHHDVIALASVKASEDRLTVNQPQREILYGKSLEQGIEDQWDPGGLPLEVPPNWGSLEFLFLRFAPSSTADALYEGFPSIHLGKALNFLIGENFK